MWSVVTLFLHLAGNKDGAAASVVRVLNDFVGYFLLPLDLVTLY